MSNEISLPQNSSCIKRCYLAAFDLGSEPLRRAALERACYTGQLSMAVRTKVVEPRAPSLIALMVLPVYRNDERKKSGVGTAGIGIGLAIVEKINQALLLNLKMCSVVGTGAQFRFQVRLDSGN